MRTTGAAVMFAAFALTAMPVPAHAQFSDSYTFLKAVRDKDVSKAKSIVSQAGSTTINTRDRETGDTALHIVTKRRDVPWINFLLIEGADVNARDREGNSALILAAGQGFTDGVRTLLARRANVNAVNNQGETALIKAVQLRDIATARVLLDNGANPDITDNVAGLSARDYAERDRRAGAIKRLIDEAKTGKPAAAAGPT